MIKKEEKHFGNLLVLYFWDDFHATQCVVGQITSQNSKLISLYDTIPFIFEFITYCISTLSLHIASTNSRYDGVLLLPCNARQRVTFAISLWQHSLGPRRNQPLHRLLLVSHVEAGGPGYDSHHIFCQYCNISIL